MRVSVVAGLIIGVHVAVIGSVVMTQGCASTQRGADSTTPAMVEPAPAPVLPPSAAVVAQPAVKPVAFPVIQPPVAPAPVEKNVAAKNVYVVKSGDSLSKIASSHGVRTAELKELNQITDANKIRIGQKLILPDYAKPSQSQPAEKAAAPAKEPGKIPAAAASGETYVVKAGDALSKIAALHGVKTKDLMAANNITDANKIRVGQKLSIPGAKAAEKKADAAAKPEEKPADAPVAALPAPVPEAAPAPAAAPAPEAAVAAPAPAVAVPAASQDAMLDYTVQEGDTAEGIARLFVVRKDDILRVNNIAAGADVKAGQQIKIPPSSL